MRFAEIDGERAKALVREMDFVREAGTDGERRAAGLLCDHLREMGAQPRMEPFTFEQEHVLNAQLQVRAPYQKTYRIQPYRGSADTPAQGLQAELLFVERADEISLRRAAGKLLLISQPVFGECLERVIQSGAIGFLSVFGSPIDAEEERTPKAPALQKGRHRIFAAAIHYMDAVELVECSAQNCTLQIRREMQTRVSHNVAVRIDGLDKKEEILTLSAHYDSVPQGPGAYDNMAGAAIIMELCRYFRKHPPRRTLEFIWFGCEEKGLLGSRAYVEQHEREIGQHRFNMNVDLAGQTIGGTVLGITAEASVVTIFRQWLEQEELGAGFRNSIWSGDSNTFAWKGIPAMTLNRDGFGMHTRHDTWKLISAWSLARSCRILAVIAENLAMLDEIPFPRSVPKAMQEELTAYFAND